MNDASRFVAIAMGLALVLTTGSGGLHAEEHRVAILRSDDNATDHQIVKGFLLQARKAKDTKLSVQLYTMPPAGDKEAEDALVARLEEFDPALVLSTGPRAPLLLQQIFFEVPILVTDVLNPIDLGMVSGFESTKNNVVGLVSLADPVVQLTTLKELVGDRLTRLGVLHNSRFTGQLVARLKSACNEVGLELHKVTVENPNESAKAFKRLENTIDAFWMLADASAYSRDSLAAVLRTCVEKKIPVLGYPRDLIRAGATIGFFPDPVRIGGEAWQLAARILAGELALEDFALAYPSADSLRIAYNPEAAKLIDLTVPPRLKAVGEPVYVLKRR